MIDWDKVISVLAIALAAVLGWTGRFRDVKKDIKSECTEDAIVDTTLKVKLEYIMRGVDDIKSDIRAQNAKIEAHGDRITRCEEIAKSAHKRLDEHIGAPRKAESEVGR